MPPKVETGPLLYKNYDISMKAINILQQIWRVSAIAKFIDKIQNQKITTVTNFK